MAKVGDHVDTIYGMATVMTGKRLFIHGTENTIESYAGDKDRDKKRRIIKGVVKTRLQIEADTTYIHKKFLKAQKTGKSTEEKEVKPKEVKPKAKAKPKRKVREERIYEDVDDDMF
jgi:hypothetical protein